MLNSTRRAFTLIELLVVIAIIAILAAILFPVFAQAREKARQTVCLSNLKQNGLAIMQYVEDYDEQMPQAELLDATAQQWQIFNLYPTPANLFQSGNNECYLCSQEWANAIQPYVKNYGVYDCPSTIDGTVDTGAPMVRTPARVAFTFNGDLQLYPQAGILSPAAVILVWTGYPKNAWVGWSSFNPQLFCPDPTQPCVYQPTDTLQGQCPQTNGGSDLMVILQPNFSVWVHGQGDNFLFADGHAKWSPLHGDYHVDPWVGEDSNGVPSQYQWDGCHSYLFRPDYQP